jgi:hypothetical protein
LFDASVVLLQSIVQIVVVPMDDGTAKGLADRTGVGIMSIGRHPLRGVTNDLDGLRRSKRLAASMSRFSAPHRVHQVTIPIDGAIEIAPVPFDIDVGFINVPGSRLFALAAWLAVGLP